MESLNMYNLKLLQQRKKVENECFIFQALVEKKLEDTAFMWYSHANYILFTANIFRKQKRQREEDVPME
jgi:hypothetical protein